MIRLFAALSLPSEISGALGARQGGILDARWRPLESLHVTLRFFGEIDETMADDLDTELARIRSPRFEMTLRGAGCFGEGPQISAVWAGVEPNAGLTHLAKSCETAARRCGLKPGTRRYTPHVTLAYLRRPDPAAVAAWIQANNLLRAPVFGVDHFGLYSSRLGSEGSHYRLERVYALVN
jgi:RNA 2',3'-cyclic 3'-phosphodiesterase